ncbi:MULTISPECIES: hypothetical protein [Actinomycetes]|uniref:hypothetical protein n=1 Tax=Actinomycetes TaxID=1760 RepID=UPI00131A032A|nr:MULTISPECIES: hypothetical protein [Actinomycetes]
MPSSLLLDSCIAINLAATGRSRDIEEVLELKYLMVVPAAKECGSIELAGDLPIVRRAHGGGGQALVAEVLWLIEAEYDMYVELAADVDDGEAATAATAHHRSISAATDDRKARRVMKSLGLAEPVGTPDLLRDFEAAAGLPPEETGAMLRDVRDRARYVARRNDPLHDWWEDRLQR